MPVAPETLVRLTADEESAFARTIEQNPRGTIVPDVSTANERERAAVAGVIGAAHEEGLAIEGTIGEGGMGVVRLATQRSLGRKVAVKTLKGDAASERLVLKLLREAWVTGALEHPNVVPVYALETDEGGKPRIVLKRIEGVAWCDLMHDEPAIKKRFDVDSVLAGNLEILSTVAQAVHFAHTRGVIHRDLKPENVMIGAFGEVYVLDWGIAVALRDDGTGRFPLADEAKEIAGTPAYMAPEMLGGGGLSQRTDVYLLGAILFEIVTKTAPHVGKNWMELVHAIARSTPTFPPDVPAELQNIITRAMAPDPDARFETAEQLRLAVRGYLKHRRSNAMVDEAEAKLQAIELILSHTEPVSESTAAKDRKAIYDLFGAARFGYRQALRDWPENDRARAGLTAVVLKLARYELEHGEPRAAETLLRELDDAPDDLARDVRDAIAKADRERQALAQLARDVSPEVGRRTRTFLATVFGSVWSLLPLVCLYAEVEPSVRRWLYWHTGSLVVGGGFALWARETLSATSFNRRMTAIVGFAFFAGMLFAFVSEAQHVPVETFQVLQFCLWFCYAGLAAIGVERRLTISAVGFAIGAVVVALRREWVYYAMSATNLLLTINVVSVWRPRERLLAQIRARIEAMRLSSIPPARATPTADERS